MPQFGASLIIIIDNVKVKARANKAFIIQALLTIVTYLKNIAQTTGFLS